MERDDAVCYPQPKAARLAGLLPHVAARLSRDEPVTIVAVGSSSTAGAGASSVIATYPARLAMELQRRFPGQRFQVINSGVNGDEVPQMLRRFTSQVFLYRPDLVIWQLGTNALLRQAELGRFEEAVRDGLRRIEAAGTDVILMDLQFAPRVEQVAAKQQMLAAIERIGRAEAVPVFHRHAVMRAWAQRMGDDYPSMLYADGLHMSDRGYRCLAVDLAGAIQGALPSDRVR